MIRLFREGKSFYLIYGILIAVILRLIFSYVLWRDKLLLFGCFLLDGITIFLWLVYDSFIGNHLTDKVLLVCLVALTLASLQQLIYEKNQGAFPFHFFLLMAVCVFLIPVRNTPIDWTPFITFYEKTVDAAKNAYYYLEDVFTADTYTTGYSSFDVTGGTLEKSEKPQLILTTKEKPYFVYTDYEQHMRKKIRRNMYIIGSRGVDKAQLVNFLNFLHSQGVDQEYANVFSQVSKIDLEYAYLNTPDEITPIFTFDLKSGDEAVTSGVSEETHENGYKLSAQYIDIDFGSPYLTELYSKACQENKIDKLSYEEACEYMESLYDVDLTSVVTAEEYQDIIDYAEGDYFYYLDSGNASERMQELAQEITKDGKNTFEKSKLIEAYLRQYTYNIEAVGGHNSDSTMVTPWGMADIADRFLFETGEGYCVHYTSSMVILLRLSGIPARAVMGYRYSFPFDEQDSYVVIGESAHVWPEAYIENVGWVPFEPTSTYSTATAYTWHRTLEDEPAFSGESQTVNTNISKPDLQDNSADYKEKPHLDGMQILKTIGLVVGSILLLLALIILGTMAFRIIRYKLATPQEKLRLDVESIKGILSKQAETEIIDRGLLSDYVSITPEEFKPEVKSIFDMYYKMVYGNGPEFVITEDQLTSIKELQDKIKKTGR